MYIIYVRIIQFYAALLPLYLDSFEDHILTTNYVTPQKPHIHTGLDFLKSGNILLWGEVPNYKAHTRMFGGFK